MKRTHRGMSFPEVMAILVLIGFMLALVLPMFIKADPNRDMQLCMASMRHIAGEKEAWFAGTGKRDRASATPTPDDLYGPTKTTRFMPVCGSGSEYILGNMKTPPRCPRHGPLVILQTGSSPATK